jgi:hypothetical protein
LNKDGKVGLKIPDAVAVLRKIQPEFLAVIPMNHGYLRGVFEIPVHVDTSHDFK